MHTLFEDVIIVEEGTAISFTVEPDEGYIGSVAVDGKTADAASISENSSAYELNIKADTEVEVTFTAEEEKEDEDEEVKEYTVTINVPEAKGAVTVNTSDESVDATNGFSGTVEKGSSLIFDVEPDEGYMIGRVAVNGKAVCAVSIDGNVSTYELNEINVDTVINIYFGTDNLGISNIINSLFGVTALAETSSNSITCTVGESKTISKPIEDINYLWKNNEPEIISVVENSNGSITVTGKNIGKGTITYEYGNKKNKKTVTYNIEVITPKVKITYEAGIGGSVSSKGEELEIEAENAQGSTAEAANGCVFYNWTDEKGEEVGSEETFVPSKPENGFVETTYTANFVEAEEIMIQFETVDSNAGTVSKSSQSLKAISGTAVSVTATPKLGYKFEMWTNDDGKTVSTNATFTPEKIDGVHVAQTYTAHFTKINVSEQTAYFYVGVPGATTDVANESWYGMGTGTIKVENKAEAYGLGTRLNELLNQEGAISFPGEYPSITDKGNNKIYKYSVDRKEPGTYYITWNEVIVSPGANKGANGHNPEIDYGTNTFHVDGTLHFVDQETHEVHFMCYIPGEEGFQYIKTSGEIGDEGSYIRIDDGGHENEINKPSMIEREGYKFDGWYTDAEFENKASFDGVITENKTYYGRYVEDENQRKTLSYTVKYYKGNSDEPDDEKTYPEEVWVHQSDALKVKEGSINKDKYPGYMLGHIEVDGEKVSEIPDVVDDGTEISVYYVVDKNQTKKTSYTVRHVVDGEERSDDTKVYEGTAWVNDDPAMIEIKEGSLEEKVYKGYRFDRMDVADGTTEVESGTTITLYYVKRTDLSYTVNYLEEGTGNNLKPAETVRDQEFGAEINGKNVAIEIDGYEFVNSDPDMLTIKVSDGDNENAENVINLYYRTTISSYNVVYNFEEGTPDKLEVPGFADIGDPISQFYYAPDTYDYNGKHYMLDRIEGKEKVVDRNAENNEVNIYYVLDEIGGGENPDEPDNIPDKYQRRVTFQVVNGTWTDETPKSMVVTFDKTEDGYGTSYTLTPEEIPGTKADKGYKGGDWGVEGGGTISTSGLPETISGDVTYTFTYGLGSYKYSVEYYYDDVNGNWTLGEAPEGMPIEGEKEYGEIVSVETKDKVEVNGVKYLFDKVVNNGLEIKDNESDSDASNVIEVYYVRDMIGNPANPDSGDGVPDKYQVVVSYNAAMDGEVPTGTVSLAKAIVTLLDADGNRAVRGTEGAKGYLVATQIPMTTPNTVAGYREDSKSWAGGIEPTKELEITGDTTFTVSWNNLYTLTIRYQYADGTEIRTVSTQYAYGADNIQIPVPELEGYTCDWQIGEFKFDTTLGEDKEYVVTYTAIPGVPDPTDGPDVPDPGTDPDDPVVPPVPEMPGAPGTPDTPVPPIDEGPVPVTPPAAGAVPPALAAPALVAVADAQVPLDGIITEDEDGNIVVMPVEDEEVPLADRELADHECCILSFLLMLATLIIYSCFTHSMKKRQKKLAELKDQLAEETLRRQLGITDQRGRRR